MVIEPTLVKDRIFPLHIAFAVSSLFQRKDFYITVAVWGPFASIILAHHSCCWWRLWKQGNFTLVAFGGLLRARYWQYITTVVGGPAKARCLHMTVAAGARLKAEYLHSAQFLLGDPSMKFNLSNASRVSTHLIGCWGPLWKQITFKLQLCQKTRIHDGFNFHRESCKTFVCNLLLN